MLPSLPLDDDEALSRPMLVPPAAPGAAAAAPALPADSGTLTPDLQAFIAQRAHEIAAAQQDAAERRKWTQLGNDFARGGDLIAGRQTDAAAERAKLEEASRPIADVVQRHGAEDAAVKDFGARQDMAAKSHALAFEQAKRDPASAVSKRIQSLWAPVLGPDAQYLSAADYEQAEKLGGLKIQALGQVAAAKRADAEMAFHNAELRQKQKHEGNEDAAKLRQLDIEQGRIGYEMGQKGRVPEAEAVKIVNMNEAIKAIDELEKLHAKTGLEAYIPGVNVGDSGRYADAVSANLPAIVAGALPQGKESPGALEEFRKMMPSPAITSERAKDAFEQLRARVKSNAKAQIAALRAGSYNSQQVNELERQANSASAPSPAPAAGQPPPGTGLITDKVAAARSRLQPGERLAVAPDGGAHALAPGEALPSGWKEVK